MSRRVTGSAQNRLTVLRWSAWASGHRQSAVRAWVSWIQQTSDRAVCKIVCVPTESLTTLHTQDAYRHVPGRIFGRMGTSGRGFTA